MKKKSHPADALTKSGQIPFADAARDLIYISETDAEILPFHGKTAAAVTSDEILSQTGRADTVKIEEMDPDAFFAPLVGVHDWFDDARRERAARFAALYNELKSTLNDLHVFKLGSIRIDIFVVGLDAEGRLTGITTKAVET